LFSIFEIVSQVVIASKKARFGPKVGTTSWWIEKIRSEPGIKYTEFWTHLSEYQLRKFKAIAEVDYKVLGLELSGAPDHYTRFSSQALQYPPKLLIKPHWLELNTISWKSFRVWSWLGAAKALDLPISEEAETWYNYLSIERTRIEAVKVLSNFKREDKSQLTPEVEFELNCAYPNTRIISSIKFSVPKGDQIYNQIQDHIEDYRPVPTTAEGWVFRSRYISDYLEKRLKEYLALGGIQELIEREQLKGLPLPTPFYWDLWADLDHLREGYPYFCAENNLDPLADDEEDEKSVASWDTQ
jgi:hypothetical protein